MEWELLVCDMLAIPEIFPAFEIQDSRYNGFTPSFSLIFGFCDITMLSVMAR